MADKLHSGKLRDFLSSMNSNVSKPQVDVSELSESRSNDVSPSDIIELKEEMHDIRRKLSTLLSSTERKEKVESTSFNKSLNYLKDKVDLLVDHKHIKGQIASIEMKQLKINVLKDKIMYLENKLDAILSEREKKFEYDKEFSILRQEKLSDLTGKIGFLEERLELIQKSFGASPETIEQIKSKINILKEKAKRLLKEKADKKRDEEMKVIKHISNMLDERKQELHDLETDLMLDKGIVRPPVKEKPEESSKHNSIKDLKEMLPKEAPVQRIKIAPAMPKDQMHTRLDMHDFELPSLFNKHELDLDLPSPVPLEEFIENMPVRRVIEKPKKKGFFAVLLGMFKGKKK